MYNGHTIPGFGERRISLRHNILTHNILTDIICVYNVNTIPGFMFKGRPDVCTMYILYLVLCLKVGLMYVQCTYYTWFYA